MLHISLEILGGLGLFFVGINLLSENIKSLGSGYAPNVIQTFARNDITGVISGLVAGIVTSSGKAVTFSLVALTELGSLNLRKSLPIVIGGSVGSAFIVLWASLDFEVVIFLLMLTAGWMYQFGNMKNPKLKTIAGVILGFALLFYGLELIKLGAGPLKSEHWFKDYVVASQGHWFLALSIGAVLAFISQSGSSVAIIAISLVDAGLLGIDDTIMLVYGTNIGSGIITALLGLSLSGISRQLVLFHGFFKIIGIAVMVPLTLLENTLHFPFAHHMVEAFPYDHGTGIAFVYLSYEIITALVILPLLGFLTPRVESIAETITSATDSSPTVTAPDAINIAIAHGQGNDLSEIKTILRNENLRIVAIKPLNTDWSAIIKQFDIDMIIVNIEGDKPQDLTAMEDLLEHGELPILIHDGSSAKRDKSDWSAYQAKFIQKIYKLTNRTMPFGGSQTTEWSQIKASRKV